MSEKYTQETKITEKKLCMPHGYEVVSYTFQIAQILVQSHFEIVSSVLEATEPASEPVTQMAVELINNYLILVQQKR